MSMQAISILRVLLGHFWLCTLLWLYLHIRLQHCSVLLRALQVAVAVAMAAVVMDTKLEAFERVCT